MAVAPPYCRSCGRRIRGRAWPQMPTYDPITHTYLCRSCRPRSADGTLGGGVPLTVDQVLALIARLSPTERVELWRRIPPPTLRDRIRARFPTLSGHIVHLLARAYRDRDALGDDPALAALLTATDDELLALRNFGQASLAEFRIVWPGPARR